jgi:hypothetical protein
MSATRQDGENRVKKSAMMCNMLRENMDLTTGSIIYTARHMLMYMPQTEHAVLIVRRSSRRLCSEHELALDFRRGVEKLYELQRTNGHPYLGQWAAGELDESQVLRSMHVTPSNVGVVHAEFGILYPALYMPALSFTGSHKPWSLKR